jgi:hypothetical protein|tara:strand:- start:126 stop:506 length:381 start_codon:yes stop_codon:yes gene_type:complete
MTQSNYIQASSQFYGKFEVVTPDAIIPCANLSTARSYIQGTREYAIVNRQRPVAQRTEQPTVECIGFVSPRGQHYAVVQMPDMDIRVDCHNSATLRGWLRDGVSFQALIEAFEDDSNVRPTGGWNG